MLSVVRVLWIDIQINPGHTINQLVFIF